MGWIVILTLFGKGVYSGISSLALAARIPQVLNKLVVASEQRVGDDKDVGLGFGRTDPRFSQEGSDDFRLSESKDDCIKVNGPR